MQIMHQSERVTSTSGGLEEGEESDSESWPGDSTSPTDSKSFSKKRRKGQKNFDYFNAHQCVLTKFIPDFYSDSDFDDTEGAEVLTSPRERTQNSGGLPQHNGSNRQTNEYLQLSLVCPLYRFHDNLLVQQNCRMLHVGASPDI